MQSSIQNLEALKHEITVTVPVEEVQNAYKSRLKEVAKTAKVNGFRPGKVPVDVIEQRFSQAVLEEIANKLIQANLEKAINDNEIRIAGMPTITDMQLKKNEPFSLRLHTKHTQQSHL